MVAAQTSPAKDEDTKLNKRTKYKISIRVFAFYWCATESFSRRVNEYGVLFSGLTKKTIGHKWAFSKTSLTLSQPKSVAKRRRFMII